MESASSEACCRALYARMLDALLPVSCVLEELRVVGFRLHVASRFAVLPRVKLCPCVELSQSVAWIQEGEPRMD